MPITGEHRRILLQAARDSIVASLSGRPIAPHETSHPALLEPAGCFVSLHEIDSHRLRGCIGRLDAREPILQAVQDAARNALSDPRFEHERITRDELPRLEIELTVLSALQPTRDYLDFDPLTQGIYLIIGSRSGCFLPQVARDTGWSREHLLDRLCTEKLDLPATEWRDPTARLFTFSAEIIGPEPFIPAVAQLQP